ncbi:glycoside hydrolase family 127 protein [Gilvimarinus sp. SDUM040013]|uniref:Glycoside hydrolase family 127 protein n=1 Tax=Gilvimarinus gilvus TaxID=3058038 RepID=A0ABU4S150_9GAMM|nr:glycoside hydrolase family 127 protein [Gilvimarinus sp. SDUM040013]MDO3387260.1 glycoside hydrolase family 127 protein [Gilvimarinus sp. SDUM040013]MDX6848949.1 glycoside hydrolase family 127 protein [Gilvimarinus sp. SDUM040013]
MIKKISLAACIGLTAFNAQAVDYFDIDQVRLQDGPFLHAQEKNLEYVLTMEPGRLLAPFLREAGLKPKTNSYGNWENTGLDGHIGGHYLTSLSLAYAATGREDVRNRINYMLDELERAQKANGNGYLGGVPNSDKLWQEIAKGDIRADLFALNGYWVPWYNLHKIFAGLRDAYVYTDSEQAKRMLLDWADWVATLVSDLSDEQIEKMLNTEYGGMNETFADVYAITGEKRYLTLAEQFSHKKILQPLQNKTDALTGLHANTQIPKVIGYERVAQETGDESWHEAADFFWDTVVNERSVAIGGNSAREHFHDKKDFSGMLEEVEGPETCNTYNMLKLTKLLYGRDTSLEYVNYYERALYNHILSSQDPETGGLVYFTPMRPNHYRMYSQPHEGMWCCVGSGIENHFKYGEFIYAHEDDDLYVNLYIPSTLTWAEKGVTLTQTTGFPDTSKTQLTLDSSGEFTLNLRYPKWAVSQHAEVTVNGEPVVVKAMPGEYISLPRQWKKGDKVELSLPMQTHLESLPDGSDYYAVMYGPIVLSAKTSPFDDEVLNYYSDASRMGHIASGERCPIEQAPMLVAKDTDFANQIERISEDELRFKASNVIQPAQYQDLELIPFFRVHQSRYMLYWPYSTPQNVDQLREQKAVAEAQMLELEAITVDKVAPGEQQPESDHFFKGSQSEAGVHLNRHWRHAHDWFSYQLNDQELQAKTLRITYFGGDVGREFAIEFNGETLAEVKLPEGKGANFYTVDYPISKEALRKSENGKHLLKFIAAEGSVAGGIYGVRLLSE